MNSLLKTFTRSFSKPYQAPDSSEASKVNADVETTQSEEYDPYKKRQVQKPTT